ncbi:MAG TPA: hypothetical protein VFB27_02505 [Opitutaceae bacterium]|nr:hypothetical protein [Opitutaceae bacterium]
MKPPPALCILLAALSLPALRGDEPLSVQPAEDSFRLSDFLPRGLQSNPRLNLSLITEVTAAGKKLTPPDRNHPVYYIAVDGGMDEAGNVIAGEQPPSTEQWRKVMIASLAGSGYLPASALHPPTLVVHCRYGSFNQIKPANGGSLDDPSTENNVQLDPQQFRNLVYKAALVGGEKFSVDLIRAMSTNTLSFFRMQGAHTDTLVNLAFDNLYYVIASAYDYDAATRGQKVLLWRTKIATDSYGMMMEDVVPTLTIDAREYFGHPTDGPVVLHPRMLSGRVILDQPVVRDYLERTPANAPAPKP